ncbi:ABC transporter permease [uncultured Ruegeria sp.]|uniref:ABC transporter permease n=1 Tax=uncultured Ruegeria sp. TaxID=259304 RepID=UPI00263348E5|nr:ABC transporter permease [uncultured Ruegeria sp.]
MQLLMYILRRLFMSAFVLLGVAFLVFVASRIVPSDPATLFAGPRPTADQIAAARELLKLDQSLWVQFTDFITSMAVGDFGISYRTRQLIWNDLASFLPATLELALFATGLALVIGIPLGVFAADWKHSWFDTSTGIGSIAAVAMPSFFLAMLLQWVFAQWLDVLPLSGRISRDISLFDPVETITGFLLIDSLLTGRFDAFWDAIKHLILPALTLAAYPTGIAMRLTRSLMIEILERKHVVAARALGLSHRRILFGHALPNAVGPALTIIGLSFAFSLTGAVLVEIIYAWPGLGRYISEAILSKDFPVIAASALVVTICYVFMNLVIDVAQAFIDPRVTVS